VSTYYLHFGCCIAYMRTMATGSVFLMVVDSPYNNTDLDFDKQPVDWAAWWVEAKRILAPTGVIICFACELFTLDLIASNRAWYRYRMVWVKSKASRYCDTSWRPLTAHEDIIVFAPAPKSATYNPQRSAYTGPTKNAKRKAVALGHYKGQRFASEYKDDGTRHPTTVLKYASVGSTSLHFNQTAKPLPLIQELVLTFSNPGELVFEPFAGDAPTGLACQNTGRPYVGCEKDLAQYEWSQATLQQHAPLLAQEERQAA
jgi:DNA modification methylase